MLNLESALKRLSFAELRARWEEYKRLPVHDQQALQTYAVVAAMMVAILIAVLATYLR